MKRIEVRQAFNMTGAFVFVVSTGISLWLMIAHESLVGIVAQLILWLVFDDISDLFGSPKAD
jgi:hypothetical protein